MSIFITMQKILTFNVYVGSTLKQNREFKRIITVSDFILLCLWYKYFLVTEYTKHVSKYFHDSTYLILSQNITKYFLLFSSI